MDGWVGAVCKWVRKKWTKRDGEGEKKEAMGNFQVNAGKVALPHPPFKETMTGVISKVDIDTTDTDPCSHITSIARVV